jgi:hypothetical protein
MNCAEVMTFGQSRSISVTALMQVPWLKFRLLLGRSPLKSLSFAHPFEGRGLKVKDALLLESSFEPSLLPERH